ncbi:MAG: hypothetical protein IIC59_14200 [Proteobacteria bacterium]|nr:hypothetical protein [Pseudomonadota bacterium]MCH8176325.1 hypothetical protein [Pseudomonadota bacterium]
MSIEIKKPAIDIGIVARDIDAMLNFYDEEIGLELEAAIPMPGGGTIFNPGNSFVT